MDIVSYPETYDATQLGPEADAVFTFRATMPCSVEQKIADTNGNTVYVSSRDVPAGEQVWKWPGALVRSDAYSMPFSVVLAPPGRYLFIVTATDASQPAFRNLELVEFNVTW